MMRQTPFGLMAALAIMLNALYILVSLFLSPVGVQYPLMHFVSGGALILALFLYGPALAAIALWLTSRFGTSHARH